MSLDIFIGLYLLTQLNYTAAHFKNIVNNGNPYCNLHCAATDHIACRWTNCKLGRNCNSRATSQPIDPEVKDMVVELHNHLRNSIAYGYDIRLNGYTAAAMRTMYYSSELEYLAQCWANYCTDEAPDCTKTKKFQALGANYVHLEHQRSSNMNLFQEAVQKWYNQIESVDKHAINRYRHGESWKMFTQMIWDKSYLLGCGNTRFATGYMVVCLYAPAGNVIGEPVFELGKPCSECPECPEIIHCKSNCSVDSKECLKNCKKIPCTKCNPQLTGLCIGEKNDNE